MSSSGQARTAGMSLWITEKLKERAQIQKQSRQYKEEFNRKGPKKSGNDDDDEGGKRWRKKKQGKGKGHDGGGASGSTPGQ